MMRRRLGLSYNYFKKAGLLVNDLLNRENFIDLFINIYKIKPHERIARKDINKPLTKSNSYIFCFGVKNGEKVTALGISNNLSSNKSCRRGLLDMNINYKLPKQFLVRKICAGEFLNYELITPTYKIFVKKSLLKDEELLLDDNVIIKGVAYEERLVASKILTKKDFI